MRVVPVSDIHGCLPEIPECDLLLLGGDLCPAGNWDEQAEWLHGPFAEWLDDVPAGKTIGIAGNHDFVFEQMPEIIDHSKINWTYLQDESCEYKGYRIHGTPWQPWFYDWAFNAPYTDLAEDFLGEKFALIKPKTDIILSHSPPFDACDWTKRGGKVGSKALRERIEIVQPKLVVCGHIHEAYGKDHIGKSLVFNASYINAGRNPTHEPKVLDLELEHRTS